MPTEQADKPTVLQPAQPAQPPAPWRAALEQAVAQDPRGKAGVAERLGKSRTLISLVMDGKKVGSRDLQRRIYDAYMAVACPHLAKPLTPSQCRAYAERSFAAISQFEVDHWRACQRCPCKAPPPPELAPTVRPAIARPGRARSAQAPAPMPAAQTPAAPNGPTATTAPGAL